MGRPRAESIGGGGAASTRFCEIISIRAVTMTNSMPSGRTGGDVNDENARGLQNERRQSDFIAKRIAKAIR